MNSFAVLLFCATAALSQAKSVKSLPVDGQIEADGSAIHLSIGDAQPPRVGNVMIKRRALGKSGGKSWKTIAPQLGPVMRYTDNTVNPGVAYEYQVIRTARDIVDVGYFTAGVELSAEERRGKAIILIDETIAADIAQRLNRLERDLIGDGWQVIRHLAPRGSRNDYVASLKKATEIRNWLQDQYLADPFARYSLILVGHIPIALSGHAAPDGHKSVPHATDLFYADMDGEWRLRRNKTGESLLGENRLPSDAIEMQVGRIDFSGISRRDRDQEIEYLRAYFDKNHHWRHGILGDPRDGYAQSGHLTVEQHGLRNILGQQMLTEGGHHDKGEEQPWLIGVDFGDHNGSRYAKDHSIKAAFVINFGSGKQKIERFGNALTATLAQPWYTVATGWGGRPSWRLHHMGLGNSIGESHMRTVNNGSAREPHRESMDYFPTGNYLWRNPVWVNLLGDPTLRAFVLAPPVNTQATRDSNGISLIWEAARDPDVTGYKVYRAAADGMLEQLSELLKSDQTSFTDTDPVQGARYMVRAYGLKKVNAGSFYTYSQGAFAQEGMAPALAQDQTVFAKPNTPILLPVNTNDPADDTVQALIKAPDIGTVSQQDGQWTFTPPTDFSGDVSLSYSSSNALSTDVGQIRVTIAD